MTYEVNGIDVSTWQGEMDWAKAASRGILFAYIRSTLGNYYVDAQFERNWEGANNVGLHVAPYIVVYPDVSGEKHFEYFQKHFKNKETRLPVALDVEVTRGKRPAEITAVIQKLVYLLESAMYRVCIYTRKSFWDVSVLAWSGWHTRDLWVAHYTTADKPLLPRDWSDWTFWQWSAEQSREGIWCKWQCQHRPQQIQRNA